MSKTMTSAEVPEAPYYVTCVDRALSGWGPAEGRENVCVFPCADEREARTVARSASTRGEMERVRVTRDHTTYTDRPDVLVSVLDRDEAPRWYEGHDWSEEDEKDETYNGWSNRETWAVNLHLTNEEGLYHAARELAYDEAGLLALAREVKLLESDIDGRWDRVNMAEVAEALRDE